MPASPRFRAGSVPIPFTNRGFWCSPRFLRQLAVQQNRKKREKTDSYESTIEPGANILPALIG